MRGGNSPNAKNTLVDALLDYEQNFDSDLIICSDDDFEEDCLYSNVVNANLTIC